MADGLCWPRYVGTVWGHLSVASTTTPLREARALAAAISRAQVRLPLIESGGRALRVHAIMNNRLEPTRLLNPDHFSPLSCAVVAAPVAEAASGADA